MVHSWMFYYLWPLSIHLARGISPVGLMSPHTLSLVDGNYCEQGQSFANYSAGPEKIDVVSKFVSQGDESADVRKATYQESIGWYEGITTDMFS